MVEKCEKEAKKRLVLEGGGHSWQRTNMGGGERGEGPPAGRIQEPTPPPAAQDTYINSPQHFEGVAPVVQDAVPAHGEEAPGGASFPGPLKSALVGEKLDLDNFLRMGPAAESKESEGAASSAPFRALPPPKLRGNAPSLPLTSPLFPGESTPQMNRTQRGGEGTRLSAFCSGSSWTAPPACPPPPHGKHNGQAGLLHRDRFHRGLELRNELALQHVVLPPVFTEHVVQVLFLQAGQRAHAMLLQHHGTWMVLCKVQEGRSLP